MRRLTTASCAAALVLAVSPLPAETPPPAAKSNDIMSAVAQLAPVGAQKASGVITFQQTGDVTIVRGRITGLPPNSTHGFHIHQYGDCSAPDAASAGDHFAPEANPHGAPGAGKHHTGDLGNVKADADGLAVVDVRVEEVPIAEGDRAVLGRSLVLHEKADDLTTQPSGNSGARIACGVIGVKKPELTTGG